MSYATGDPLAVRIRIAFGASIAADPATWVWTDVTAWWHVPDSVTTGWGRSSGAEQPETSTFSATLKNTDGRFTAYDPRSPYWPNVRKWTPISFDVDLGDGVGWRNRFSGFIRKWPLTWPGASSLMALARIEAVGVLGRLGRGKPPARSAMRRSIAASSPGAYWPLEDGDAAVVAASALPGQQPIQISGAVQFTAIEDVVLSDRAARYGTGALIDLSGGGRLVGTVPASVTATMQGAWTVEMTGAPNISQSSGDVVLFDIDTPGGTFVRWQLVFVKATTRTQVIATDGSGTATAVIDVSGAPAGGFITTNLSVWQSGGTINVGYNWLHYTLPSGAGMWTATGSIAGTLSGPTQVTVNRTGATHTVPFQAGHLAVWPVQPTPIPTFGLDVYGYGRVGAILSWRDEAATERLSRLCAEDRVPLTMPAVPDDAVTRMGWQQPGTPLDLYQQCEAADLGLLYESGFGLGYLPRGSRYNAPVALTVDAAAGQLDMPFEPVDDDQTLRNRWTVERSDGSSAVAEDAESIDLQGEIEGSATVNLADDFPLPDHAGWRLHMSTVPEPRYPAVSITPSNHRELAAAWCSCKPGSRVQVVNPPEQNVPGVVDQLVVGATETYAGRTSWKATLNVVPASPWQVATANGDERAPADDTTLAGAGLPAAGMTYQFTSTAANGRWGTAADGAEFPLDVLVGGELIRLSAITGTGLTQTATIAARGLNGFTRAWPPGTPVDVAYPAVAPL